MSASALYEGTIRHRRSDPVEHAFTSRIALLYLDLDELPAVLEHPPLWSARRRAVAGFRRRDHLGGDTGVPLADAIRDEVQRQAGVRPSGPVRLLTAPRTFGRAFNPVTFAFCFDAADGATVRHVLAQVTNTPWGETHAYVMTPDGATASRVLRAGFDKAFHVSPFMGMDHRYTWSVTAPGETLSVHIASARDGATVFDATLALHRRPLTGRTLNGMLARFPFGAARTLALIYGHAVRLKLKGAPVFRHPESISR